MTKVKDILNDSEAIEDILKDIGSSEKETAELYKENKARRIQSMVTKAGVTMKEYEEALSYTKIGYKVVIERDLTEIFVNSYNTRLTNPE